MTRVAVNNQAVVSEIIRLFVESEIQRIDRNRHPSWPESAMAFEDEYAVIAVWTFESTDSLVAGWGEAQDHFVQLLEAGVVANDPKSWDGYLVLATVDGTREDLVAEISNIRSDTRRVRKLILTAEDLPNRVTDPLEMTPYLRRSLAPILDLEVDSALGRSDPLESLSSRLAKSLEAAQYLPIVIGAYQSGESPLEALHDQLALLHDDRARS